MAGSSLSCGEVRTYLLAISGLGGECHNRLCEMCRLFDVGEVSGGFDDAQRPTEAAPGVLGYSKGEGAIVPTPDHPDGSVDPSSWANP